MRPLIHLLLVLLAGALAGAQAPKALVIRNVQIFDGARVLPGSVLVEGGRIKAVGSVTAPTDADVVDGAGHTLLPGLIDAHAHSFPGTSEQSVAFGVTTVLDMFTAPAMMVDLKQRQADNPALADLRSSGVVATAPGGHGTEYGIKIPTLSSPGEADAFVEARVREGSDYLKIIIDDGSAYGVTFPTLDSATVKALVAAARKRNLLSVAHVGRLRDAQLAVDAGVDGLAHIFADERPGDDWIKLVVARKIFVIPTLSVLTTVAGAPAGSSLAADPLIKPYLGYMAIGNLSRSFGGGSRGLVKIDVALETVGRLQQAGAPILAGSDAPNPGTTHGASMHGEVALLVKAGLSPIAALSAATLAPATAFHLADRGRIAPGGRADLVLVKGDPTRDIHATRSIVRIFKEGRAVDREAYRGTLQSEPKRTAPIERGLVSDFEEAEIKANFGAGWLPSTDAIAGGKSRAALKRVDGGAEQSRGALHIEGELLAGAPFPWAGAMFSPGPGPFQPANVSKFKELSFWARGEGKTYHVLVWSLKTGFMPITKTFDAGPEWQRHSFQIPTFDGLDGSDLTGLFLGRSQTLGTFWLEIDRVEFR